MVALALLSASAPAIAWLTIGLVTTVAMVALLIALVRHALLLGRSVARFQEEVAPILEEMSAENAAVSRPGSDPP
jgi:hypothetical protein